MQSNKGEIDLISESDFLEEESLSNKKTWLQRVNHGLFGILYLMAKEVHTTQSVLYLLTLLNTCQVLYFSFAQNVYFPWHSSLDPVVQIVHYLNFGFFVHHNLEPQIVLAIFLVVLFLVSSNIFLASYVGLSFARGNVKSLWMLSVLRTLARLTTTVLFLPLSTVLLLQFSCHHGYNAMLGTACGSIEHIAVGTITAIVLLLFVSFTALTVLVFVDRNPVSPDCMAQPNGRVMCFVFLINLGLDVIFVNYDPPYDSYHPEMKSQQLVLAITVLAATASTTFAYVYYLPFYSLKTNMVYLCASSCTLWSAICLVFCIVVGDPKDLGPTLLLIGGLPLFVFFTNHLIDWRVQNLLNTPLQDIGSPILAEVKLRLEYQLSTGSVSSGSGREEDIKPFDPLTYTQKWRTAIQLFPRSAFLHFQLSNVYYNIARDELMGGRYFRKASMLENSLDQYFIVFQQQRMVEENQAGGMRAMDALSFIAFEHHFQEAKRRITDAQRLQVAFWKMLLDSRNGKKVSATGSNQALFDLGGKVHSATSFAKYHLNRLIRVSGASPRALRLYAKFLDDVLNDSFMAAEFMAKADQVEENIADETNQIIDDDANFNARRKVSSKGTGNVFNEKLNMVTISGEEDDLGHILAVTEGCCRLFGFRKFDLIGKNISALTPNPFSKFHDKFLQRYFDTGNPHILNCTRMVFGLHSDGFIFPVNLQVTPMPAADGTLLFIGQFTQIVSQNEFILTERDGTILSCTKPMHERLGMTRLLLREQHFHILQLFPETVMHESFVSDDLVASINATNEEEETFLVTKTPVHLKSDSPNEQYDIRILMFRLKYRSSQYSVASSRVSRTLQPLGFMKDSEATPKPTSYISPIKPEKRISIEEENGVEPAKKRSFNSKSVAFAEPTEKKALPKLAIPLKKDAVPNEGGCAFANLMDSPTNCPSGRNRDDLSSQGTGGDTKDRCPVIHGRRGRESSSKYSSVKSTQRQSSLEEEGSDVLAPLPNTNVKAASPTPTRQQSGLTDGASEAGTSVTMSIGHRKERLHQFHRIIESRNNHPDPHIQRLQKIFVVMISSFSCIAVVVCVFSLRSFTSFSTSHSVLKESFQRTFLMQEAINNVHAVQLVGTLKAEKQLVWLDTVNRTNSLLSEQAEELQTVHELMTTKENGPFHFQTNDPYGVSVWSTLSISKQENVYETLNLYVAVRDFISNLRKNSNDEDLECGAACMYILINGPQLLVESTNDFSKHWFNEMHDELKTNSELNFWGMILVSVYLAAAIAKGFFPVVTRIASSKEAVASAFGVIPLKTLQMILSSCEERLIANQNSEANAISNDNENAIQGSRRGSAGFGRVSRTTLAASKFSVDRNPKSRKNIRSKRVHPSRTPKQKKSRFFRRIKGWLGYLKVLIRLCIMFLTVIAYFAALWQWDYQLPNEVARYSYNTFLSGNRLLKMSQLGYWAQYPYAFDHFNVSDFDAKITETAKESFDLNQALVVGFSSRPEKFQGSVRPAMQGDTSQEQLNLLFHRGCIEGKCTSASRSLEQGLYLGFEDYLREIVLRTENNNGEPSEEDYNDMTWNRTAAGNATDVEKHLFNFYNPEAQALKLALKKSVELYVLEGEGFVSQLVTMRVVALIMFIVGISALYLFIHRTSIRQMDMELKHTRAMLLMVPGDVFEKVPSMKNFIKNMQAGDI